MAILLDGKKVSAQMQAHIRERVERGFTPDTAPRLCVILVGENPASAAYVRTKCRMAEKLGFSVTVTSEVYQPVLLSVPSMVTFPSVRAR